MNNKIATILINYNGIKDTKECIRSLKKSTVSTKIIVVDNASFNDEGSKLKEEFPEIEVLILKDNIGFSGGNNAGIKWALEHDYQYICMLNNDTLVDDAMIEKLKEANDNNSITTPLMYYYSHPDIIWYGGGYINYWTGNTKHRYLNKSFKKIRVEDCTFATGCCLFFNVEIIKKIGLLDESYFMYCEDSEFSLRCKKNNIKITFVPNAKLWHKVGMSTGGGASYLSTYYITRNKLYYIKKYSNYFFKTAYWYTIFSVIIKMIIYYLKKDKLANALYRGLDDYFHNVNGKVDLND